MAYVLASAEAYVPACLEACDQASVAAYDLAFTKDILEVVANILAEDNLEEGHHQVAFHILGVGLNRQDTFLEEAYCNLEAFILLEAIILAFDFMIYYNSANLIQFDCRIREYLVQKVKDKIWHLINQTSLMKQASHNKLYWDQNFD